MKTRIVVVLDESGSMLALQNDTVGGFNTFLKEQRAMGLPDDTLRLIRFSHEVRSDSGELPLAAFPDLVNYYPSGGTALIDALYEAIEGVGTPAQDERILVLTQTDGEENSSKRHTLAELRALVDTCEKSGVWTFAFMGAGIDAFAQASATLGATASIGNTVSYAATSVGTQTAWAQASASSTTLRATQAPSTKDFYYASPTATPKTKRASKKKDA